jgi:hypothetical protein
LAADGALDETKALFPNEKQFKLLIAELSVEPGAIDLLTFRHASALW